MDFLRRVLSLLFLFFFVFVSADIFASGKGTIEDPYTTLTELSTASCGNTVYLKSGIYTVSGTTKLVQACTSSTQLIIKCSNGSVESKGSCILQNTNLKISGSYITIDGFQFGANDFSKIPLEIDGGGASHNTIINCKFTGQINSNGFTIGRTSSNNTHNTITRCLFTGTWGGYIVRIRAATSINAINNTNNVVTRNVFDAIPGNAGYGVIQIGDGQAWNENYHYYTTVTHNLFLNCNTTNALNEFFEIKTGSNKINYNTFSETGGNISLRVGNNNEVIGNIFKRTTPNKSNYFDGIRVSGHGHKIINNYLEGYESSCNSSGYASMGIIVYWGGETCGGSGFPPVYDVLVANNTIRNTCRGFGMYRHNSQACPIAPTRITYLNNLGESNVSNPNYELFGGGDLSLDGNIWISNRGHTTGQVLKDATITSGVDDSGGFKLTNQKTGLPVNWYSPSVYTKGTANDNVRFDIKGHSRANPPDIGCDESGGLDYTMPVGPTWTGIYTIQYPYKATSILNPPGNLKITP